MSPGPDMAIIVRHGLVHGKTPATYTAIGIGTGILVHVLYSVLGLGLILATYPSVFVLLKYLGVAYLIFLAYSGVRDGYARLSAQAAGDLAANNDTPLLPLSATSAFRTGFLTNALNIKATMFFLSVYLLVAQQSPPVLRVVYGMYMAVATGLYFVVLARLVGRLRPFLRAYTGQVEILTAILMAVLALLLAWTDVPAFVRASS